ncbi:hypothetical protein [Pseudofrankia asymbiotica]|uniref:Uncharacterized protein n=1 Tax=Pseudofrankia asymbiotica TaxID=1834516 RepID=A0A1V2I7Z6_9ACTN|nr:hypothetical protein [Pseudofrankia asymbiotica]ONH28304.1 hypothetical protein BL253_19935 [Pseudofrankia asymbiotica]
MRTFDLDAFDPHDRTGEHVLPWEMWERDRPWRADNPDPAPTAAARSERTPPAPDDLPGDQAGE